MKNEKRKLPKDCDKVEQLKKKVVITNFKSYHATSRTRIRNRDSMMAVKRDIFLNSVSQE